MQRAANRHFDGVSHVVDLGVVVTVSVDVAGLEGEVDACRLTFGIRLFEPATNRAPIPSEVAVGVLPKLTVLRANDADVSFFVRAASLRVAVTASMSRQCFNEEIGWQHEGK